MSKVSSKKKKVGYKIVEWFVWLFYKKCRVEGAENLPDGPCIAVGNHSKMNGPIMAQLYYPREGYIWCISEMMHIKEVPAYAYRDFWWSKPSYIKWFFKLASYVIAPIGSFLLSNADTLPVYKDKRVMTTFKESLDKLKSGSDIIIFPECLDPYNNIVHDFQKGFVDVAALYCRQTGKDIPIVPIYICPALKKLVIGKPIYYNHIADRQEEGERIRVALMDAVSELAYSQAPHTVVPYPNIPKREYPSNTRPEGK